LAEGGVVGSLCEEGSNRKCCHSADAYREVVAGVGKVKTLGFPEPVVAPE
jgi:hypothetical protein